MLTQLRKASFVGDFNEDPSVSANIRYFFPEGCKGIDVEIDNSSRLRSLASSPYVHIRLPVTLKPSTQSDDYETPPPLNGYELPGPPHIYAPNQIVVPSTAKPPTIYLPPTETTTKPPVVYLPPVETTTKPPNIYLPPVETTTEPPNIYLPPVTPEDPTNIYLPPVDPPSSPPPAIITEIIPPPEVSEETCGSSTSCCEEKSAGKFIIPIQLKSSSCCARVAKLILPVNGFDEDSIRKLTKNVGKELDATQLLINILSNLVK